MNEKRPEPISADLEWPASTRQLIEPPEEFQNPPGVGGDACEAPAPEAEAAPCDPSASEDLVMEESKPGIGIEGYEGEEVGGA